jgi:A/G-specific adenine glycosylase
MLEVPNLPWRDTPYEKSEVVIGEKDLETKWIEGEPVRHVFTHFELRMRVFAIHTASIQGLDGYHYLALAALGTAALPSLMQKIIASGQLALELATNR